MSTGFSGVRSVTAMHYFRQRLVFYQVFHPVRGIETVTAYPGHTVERVGRRRSSSRELQSVRTNLFASNLKCSVLLGPLDVNLPSD